MSKKGIITIIVCALISSIALFWGYETFKSPQELYRVYLSGKTIGYIKDKELLETYIDDEQIEIKDKYKVDKVYAPNNLDIIKEITYNKKVSTEKEIYESIKDIAPFTIQGYTVTIKGIIEEDGTVTSKDKEIYVLNKETFEDAVKTTVSVFVTDTDYQNFVSGTQPELKDVGKLIEDIYIQNQITIKQGNISTEGKIFTNSDELSRYLLFGTLEEQKKYTVKSGDVISDIAYNNKLSVKEFLIANPEFTSENNLLYEGQVVNLGLINPLFNLIEEDHVVEIQTQKFNTKIEYDSSLLVGFEKVKQQGVNGTLKVTKKVQKNNGEVELSVITNTEVIKPAVNKIIVKGSKVVPTIGNPGVWYWPTNKPYDITSYFGYRWGKLHEGLDISGTGYGSPIYAANNGTVEIARWDKTNGYYIYINHNNGYYSVYAHMKELYVKPGQAVSMGTQIGTMGNTGYVVPRPTAAYPTRGTHLHFAIYKGYPYRGGVAVNPLRFY